MTSHTRPPALHLPPPTTPTLFTTHMVTRAIKNLQHSRASDHTGLQSEHLIYAATTLSPLIAHMFNRALTEGFPPEWTMHTIVPIHKAGDAMDPGNYRTIMIGHVHAKLYGAILEAKLSTYTKDVGLRVQEQTGFRRGLLTLDHIFVLRCLIDQTRIRRQRLYCCFVDFRKAFDTVPRDRLFSRWRLWGSPWSYVGAFTDYMRW